MEITKSIKVGYKSYISGLKGFACVMVMLGHFIGLYKYTIDFPERTEMLDLFNKFITSKIGFIIDENFWVVLFFVVSGYLVANTGINSFKDVAYKGVMRFLRLGIPVFFAYIIIFIIYKTVGFYTSDTLKLFVNEMIQEKFSEEYSFLDVLKAPVDVLFFNKVSLNAPYWVLREMFITSLLIYFFNWLKNKLSNENAFFIILFPVLIISMGVSNVVFAGLFGMVLCFFEKDENKIFGSNKIFVFMLVVFSATLYFIPRSRISCVFFGALIVLIPKLPLINKVFSSKFAGFLGKISFGIYSFHWPIFCSVGLKFFMDKYESIGMVPAWLIISLFSMALTVLVSIAFYYLIEKNIYAVLKKVKFNKKVN